MNIPVSVSISQNHYEELRDHLFPGDGKEAVSILLCSRRDGDRRHKLIVKEVYNIPYESCSLRTATQVTWSVDQIADLLEKSLSEELSVIKMHSHPTAYPDFSETDNRSDRELLPIVRSWVEHDFIHGSAVMLPSGEIFGRYMNSTEEFIPISSFCVAGDNIEFWYSTKNGDARDFAASHSQIFGEGTFNRLNRLSIAIIGCSGTGSPLIEQLARLGVGEIVLVDDDVLEDRNLNRILNSTIEDAQNGAPKVEVIGQAISRIGIGTRVITHEKNLWDTSVVKS
ncbi:MAG: ThiF family adenylyltransferase, partial [Gammaproteobacteria bacterium]|nr:ThiF family adenylyltransferase [Gammaproteobacteria bacterium]